MLLQRMFLTASQMKTQMHNSFTEAFLSEPFIDISWKKTLENALNQMDSAYLEKLQRRSDWLPGINKMFNAFRVPMHKTKYILFGESPYPRKPSANGFAFWDNAVHMLWSDKGLSVEVNRATSLRNFIKMLLVTDELLQPEDLSQAKIAQLDKRYLIATLDALFQKLIQEGFLLLNASLVFVKNEVPYHAKAWLPFMQHLLEDVQQKTSGIQLILFGKIAQVIQKFPISKQFPQLVSEHPYNLSFIQNTDVQQFFKPMQLLKHTP